MIEVAEDITLVDEVAQAQPIATQQRALQTAATPSDLIRYAMDNNADLDRLERLWAMQKDFQAVEAEKAYNVAFAAFKSEAVKIMKAKQVTDGPLKGKSYAELHDVVNAVTPALSRHGLAASWKLTKDDKDWLEVTCTLKHIDGHAETVSMGGPPDVGGAKNALQARASTKSYLERYTLKAICGVAEGGDDNDGNDGGAENTEFVQGWIDYATSNKGDPAAFKAACKKARDAFGAAKDGASLKAFNKAMEAA